MALNELRHERLWPADCFTCCVSTTSTRDMHDELFQRITEISSLGEKIDCAVKELVERHGDRSETVAAARGLRDSVAKLRRDLLQNYLECRIIEAARAQAARNN
jgi:hypothetical protein